MSTATGYAEFGFGDGDASVKSKGNKRFDPKELDKTYRVSFVWWPGLEEGKLDMDAETPRFIGGPHKDQPTSTGGACQQPIEQGLVHHRGFINHNELGGVGVAL